MYMIATVSFADPRRQPKDTRLPVFSPPSRQVDVLLTLSSVG